MRIGGESNRPLGRILRKSSEDYRAIRGNEIGGLGTLAMKNTSNGPRSTANLRGPDIFCMALV